MSEKTDNDSVLAGIAAAPALTPPSFDTPQLGERYAIEKEIGRGGMGRVFLARDRRLGRDVAIKVLPPGVDSEASRRRFEQEARAAAQLAHPNIVVVHDIGNAGGAPYIVSELLHGCTLRHRLSGGPISIPEVIDWTSQLASGLAAAHQRGIIHRDLKPENLFLTDEGRLKILDFGVAKLSKPPEEACEPSLTPNTETGAIIGTVGYMSPEQVRGEPVDARSEIFSAGAILYELLSGHSAFRRGSRLETDSAIIHSEPAPLPARVPAALQAIVHRCLRKERGERFASAHALGRALAEASGRGRLRRRWMAVALAIAALAAIALWQRRTAPRSPRITLAAADIDNQTQDEQLDSLSGLLITSLEQSSRLSVLTRGRMLDVAKQLGKPDVKRIDDALGREIARRLSAHALVLSSIQRFGDVYAIDLKVVDPIKDEYLFTRSDRGEGKESILAMIDRLAEETRSALNEKVEAELDPKFALAHFELGLGHAWQRDAPKVVEEFEVALRLGLPDREQCLAEAELMGLRRDEDRARQLIDGCAVRFPQDKAILYSAAGWRGLDQDGAAPYLERAVAMDPTFQPAVTDLIETWQGLGRAGDALAKDYAARTPLRGAQCASRSSIAIRFADHVPLPPKTTCPARFLNLKVNFPSTISPSRRTAVPRTVLTPTCVPIGALP